MTFLGFVLAALVVTAVAAQVLSSALVIRRFRRGRPADGMAPRGLTVLRPVCGVDHRLYETLSSTFDAGASDLEIIFCVASNQDPAIEVIRRVIAEHPETEARLLVGDEQVSGNPKLNNLVKGWAAARHEWIAMIDSNVLLPRGYVAEMFAAWTPGTGMVTSPALGAEPESLAAEVEAAFLNTYQARWQLAAEELGMGFAQGKVLFWRRDVLDAAGGPAALGRELAEDVASTKVVRAAGLKVRLLRSPYGQPLGVRETGAVWQRQLRWAKIRREGFPLIFAAELLTGPALLVAGLAVLCAFDAVSPLVVPLLLGIWYGCEWRVARAAGWPMSPRALGAAVLRDALLPLVWFGSFALHGIVWRGNDVSNDPAHVQGAV